MIVTCYIATSAQRLIDTGNPEPHDFLLFKHEALEAVYMAQGMGQREAREAANRRYNYQQALKEWRESGNGGRLMLVFRKLREDEASATYEFQIEGDPSRTGRVVADKASGTARLLGDNPDFEQKWYGSKLVSALEKQDTRGKLKDSGTIMWY